MSDNEVTPMSNEIGLSKDSSDIVDDKQISGPKNLENSTISEEILAKGIRWSGY